MANATETTTTVNVTTNKDASSSFFKGRGKLEQVVAELQRQRDTRVDFVADTRQLFVDSTPEGLVLKAHGTQEQEWLPTGGAPITYNSLPQVGSRLSPSVPVKFNRELAANEPVIGAELLSNLMQANGARRMIRLLDGKVRAFLSDRYRVMDHLDFLMTALEVAQANDARILECWLTDTGMRVKMTTTEVADVLDGVWKNNQGAHEIVRFGDRGNRKALDTTDAPVGTDLKHGQDTVYPMVTISNSETGHGGLSCQWGVVMGACMNGLILEDAVRSVHLGGKLDEGIFSEETREKESEATVLKVRDAIRGAFDPDTFKRILDRAREASKTEVLAPKAAVDNIVKVCNLSESAADKILEHFLSDYSRNALGMAQAVSRHAQDVDDESTANDLERAAGAIIARPVLAAVEA